MSETNWKLYISNKSALTAMLEACERAKETIDLEQFIFIDDEIGKSFINICTRKAEQGVKIRFIWDAAGSFSFFGSSIVDDLKKKNIELVFFKTLFPGFFTIHNYRSWYFRNHRRTLVIDGKIGFTGSICVSKRMENWRDTNVRIEGPVVIEMGKKFDRMWDRAHNRRVSRIGPDNHRHNEFEYIANTPFPRNKKLYNRTIESIRNAKKSIYITTPYFVPTHRFSKVLRLAMHRGVDIRIIIPERSDYPIVDLGARTFFHSMLKAGIKIYLYQKSMLHSKTIIIDECWSSIGTMNIDNISLLYNFEANIITTNSRFAEELTAHFNQDIKNSKEITYSDWKRRFFVEKIASFFVKIFRDFL